MPTKPNPTRWTDARKALIKELWEEGKSAKEIAEVLSGARAIDEKPFSRNSVLSLIHRGKVEVGPRTTTHYKARTRPGQPRDPNAPRKPPAPRKPRLPGSNAFVRNAKPYTPRPPRPVSVEPVPENARSMPDLPKNTCLWPVNQAATPKDHLFCGMPRPAIKSYCQWHEEKSISSEPKRARTR